MTITILQHSDVTTAIANGRTQKNSRITNTNGFISFGQFPVNNHNFPTGEIHLKLGFIGNGRQRRGAYGLRHIWEKHGRELRLNTPMQVINFIETILQPGANIIVDYSKSADKPLIVESNNGLMTLGLISPNNELPYYHIITAYGRRNHPGTVIASL